MELQVGTWWATRIGTLLIIIFAVFFTVYVSKFTPPIVKLLELALVACVVTGGGLWLERKYEILGGVVHSGGLALVYFTVFAAYAVRPVKILESSTIAMLLQFVTAMGIMGWALKRNSQLIATMAIFFGYVSCLFSFSSGLNNYALAVGRGLCLDHLPARLSLLFMHAGSLAAVRRYRIPQVRVG
jgi:hypothetical protein